MKLVLISPRGKKNTVIWDKLKTYINDRIKPIVVLMAEAAGHKVLYLPPHHSDLQPIELVWANVKGTVGRQYTTNTTFKTVLTRLKKAFDELDTITVRGCINKANKHLDELREHIVQQEDNDEAAGIESNESDSDSDLENE